MVIIAKFASICPCCSVRIVPGAQVEWTKGSPAKHVACGPTTVTMTRPAAAPRARSAARGKWNGCSCGAREMPDGSLSGNACWTCRHDAE